MAPRIPLVLLGGAGLPVWIWDGVRDALGGGSTVPPGLGDDLRSSAVAAFDYAPEGRFAIVAHGSSGVVAAEMARLDPYSVAAIVGIAAVVPRSGASYLDTVPFPASVAARRAVRGGGVHPALQPKALSGVDAAVAGRLRAEIVDEAEGRYRDPLQQLVLPSRRAYVITAGDPLVPLEAQRGFARVLDASTETLGGGHLPMLEQPRQLAGAIERLLS